MSRVRGAFVGLCVALAALTAASSAATAVRIKQVDIDRYPTVRVTVLTSKDTVAAPKLVENGKPAPYLDASRSRAKSVVLAVDRSHSMEGGVLESATSATRKFVAAKPRLDRVALYTFGSKALQLTGFASDTIDVDSALRALSVDGGQGTRLYDTVVLASLALQHQPKPRVLVLLTDGRDVDSRSSLADAVDTAQDAGVSVYAIGMAGPQLTPGPLKTLARRTGGTYYSADRTEAFLTGTYATHRRRAQAHLDPRVPHVAAPRRGAAADRQRRRARDGESRPSGSRRARPAPRHEGLLDRRAPLVLVGRAADRRAVRPGARGGRWLAFAKPRQEWLRERLEPWEDDAAKPAVRRRTRRMKALAPFVAATDTRLGDTRVGEEARAGARAGGRADAPGAPASWRRSEPRWAWRCSRRWQVPAPVVIVLLPRPGCSDRTTTSSARQPSVVADVRHPAPGGPEHDGRRAQGRPQLSAGDADDRRRGRTADRRGVQPGADRGPPRATDRVGARRDGTARGLDRARLRPPRRRRAAAGRRQRRRALRAPGRDAHPAAAVPPEGALADGSGAAVGGASDRAAVRDRVLDLARRARATSTRCSTPARASS